MFTFSAESDEQEALLCDDVFVMLMADASPFMGRDWFLVAYDVFKMSHLYGFLLNT